MDLYKDKYKAKTIRLKNWNYANNSWYFVTICTKDALCYFGKIINNQINLSEIGKIAQKFWLEIPQHFKDIYLDQYVIMPNHIHGIIIIDHPNCNIDKISNQPRRGVACNASTYNDELSNVMSEISPKKGSLSSIIRSYKSAVTHWCRKNNHDYFAWQPRFYEHIIRDDNSLDNIRNYIKNNPLKWEEDQNNPEGLWF